MPIDPGLGGWGGGYAPVPVPPSIIYAPPTTPVVETPVVESPVVETPVVETTGIDISSATEYRGHYYEIAQSLTGDWIWFVYIGTQTSWGISGVAIGGGTSDTEAAALEQVHGIIDGLSDDPEYVPPPITEEFDLGIEVPEFGVEYLGMFCSGSSPTIVTGDGNGNGNGNGKPTPGTEYEMIGLFAVISAAWVFKTKIFNKMGVA